MPIVSSASFGPTNACFVTDSKGPSDSVCVDVIEFNGLNSGIRMVADGSCGILYWLAGRLSIIMSLSKVVVVVCCGDGGGGGKPLLWPVYFILFGRLRNT